MGVRENLKKEHGSVPVLERYELIDRINKLDTYNKFRDQALICFLYLTGCRIEEVVIYKDEKKHEIKGMPIKKKQVEVMGERINIMGVRTLKRKDDRFRIRNIPIYRSKRWEFFIKKFLDYYNTLSDDDYMFRLSRQRVNQILEGINLFPHQLRHIRLTHLNKENDYDGFKLKQFTGWTDSRPADVYIHLNVEDLYNKQKETEED